MNTKDLVLAIASGSAEESQNAFNAIAKDLVTAAIQNKREEIASSLFNKKPAPVTEE